MSDLGDVLNFFLRLNDIKLQNEKIEAEKAALAQSSWSQAASVQSLNSLQKAMLEGTLTSSEQTLEVIKLTRAVLLLTVLLVIIGLAQLAVMLFGFHL